MRHVVWHASRRVACVTSCGMQHVVWRASRGFACITWCDVPPVCHALRRVSRVPSCRWWQVRCWTSSTLTLDTAPCWCTASASAPTSSVRAWCRYAVPLLCGPGSGMTYLYCEGLVQVRPTSTVRAWCRYALLLLCGPGAGMTYLYCEGLVQV